ncbi:sensor histidine kinase [Flavivirga spongiicola]|uniref:histidine kinase n=1 Tax=Flavivirga spongiicola TaxID=421621 RepID=A0ABU7XMY1_9FLAO|nr:ATP-binding protein [Flavivirga sp. MEBiC05379]MDO5981467.1 ATP-binding protein [Flavivirga sp. MEBiC05379]
MDEKEIQSFLIISSVVLFILIITMISLFILFQKRKNALILKNKFAEKHFEQEISKAQIEIREETFRNISWELHDNIGQLLTLAKIQLQNDSPVNEVKGTLDKCIKELRDLSKLISPDALKNMSLEQAVADEINRFNRLNFIESQLIIKGQQTKIDSKIEIVFFRILQEFFSNTIKHAKATHLDILLDYQTDMLIITAEDNGLGFDIKKQKGSGIGLNNIKNRAKLVNANATILSKPNKGTKLTITYKLNHESTYSSDC